MIKLLFASLLSNCFLPIQGLAGKPPAAFTAPAITAVYDAKTKSVTVRWQQQTSGIRSFVVQRSNDNIHWTDIARLENIVFNAKKTWTCTDSKPLDGENHYRLQCIAPNGSIEYSLTVNVISSGSHHWIMYPVPVGDVLTLQYKGADKITGVINVQIQSINGTILHRLRCASYTTLIRIPVNNLGRGIYDIRIMIADEIVWSQRFAK